MKTTITVEELTHDKLMRFKLMTKAKNLDAVIKNLIRDYYKFRRLENDRT